MKHRIYQAHIHNLDLNTYRVHPITGVTHDFTSIVAFSISSTKNELYTIKQIEYYFNTYIRSDSTNNHISQIFEG